MVALDLILVAVAAGLGLAGGWALARAGRRDPAAGPDTALEGCVATFSEVFLVLDGEDARLVGGADAAPALAAALGAPGADAESLATHLAGIDGEIGEAVSRLKAEGTAFGAETGAADARILIEGRTMGALALVRLSGPSAGAAAPGPSAALDAFLDARAAPAWSLDADGKLDFANRAWLAAVGAASLDAAKARGLSLDAEADRLAREAARLGQARTVLRWMLFEGERRAFRIRASPLAGGGVAIWSDDVTEAQAAAEALGGHEAAQEAMLGQIADAVAVFDADRRLAYHNSSFAGLWDLEPAWLADRPSHTEILDRLRRRGRLPEQDDYQRFKAAELARHEALSASPEAIWRLPDERTLRVASQPHPRGGLVMVFSDVTPELRLRAQFNHLLQVQQATLDKLTDAVAVFGADGRLRLHNEAFERFWSADPTALTAGVAFDTVVELAQPRIHDLQFWRDLKARITDPDPVARAPMLIEMATADRRIVAHQSRPLPDGATLISFDDVTDTRQLERALADRESALGEIERLKREFVGSVSYELRTPLTTIVGYAELLEHEGAGLDARARGHLTSIRAAATQLARSINNVLDMAQFDAGEVAAEMADVDVGALIGEAAQRWRLVAGQQKVTLVMELAEGLGLMRGDARRMGEMLDHLTENAISHTPVGGHVTLSAERALGEVRLQVSDTGRGIPFHVQAHIFDRFSGRDPSATGLGLALVKAMVELHGGWVSLESEPGAGATFTCHLPEAAEASQARPELF